MSDQKEVKAIVYSRFSPRPNAADSDSIQVQQDKCRSYCEATSMDILAFYADQAMSGKSMDNRPDLLRAIQHAKDEKAVLVVYSLSRLARNTSDTLRIAEELQQAGAGLALLDLQVSTTTPAGKMMLTMLAAFATFEREVISQRTSDSMLFKSSQGKRVGRYARYGWNLDGIQVPVEQAAIQRIRDMGKIEDFVRAKSLLNSEGWKRRGGRKWKAADVRKIYEQSTSKSA